MRITNKFFCIPPYLSTHWSNIASLQTTADSTLIVNLMDRNRIEIPGLDRITIDMIFQSHAAFLEQLNVSRPSLVPVNLEEMQSKVEQFRLGFAPIDIGGSVFQHDSNSSSTPDIPQQILEKIVSITKIIAPGEQHSFPKPEPHCNCVHCQVAKVFHQTSEEKMDEKLESKEEEISPNDLDFQQWHVNQTGEQLYTVINKLDDQERYNVFLGEPVGCTCGRSGCEHIIAVLRT